MIITRQFVNTHKTDERRQQADWSRIMARGGHRGGYFTLVEPPRGLERKNHMGTNIGKSQISDNL